MSVQSVTRDRPGGIETSSRESHSDEILSNAAILARRRAGTKELILKRPGTGSLKVPEINRRLSVTFGHSDRSD
jgi:hypothetical protein